MTVIAHYFVCKTMDEIWQAVETIGEMRGSLPYDIDGAVIKVNELEARKELRDTAKNAGYQVAYKYPPERKLTYMTAILENWQDPEIRDAYLQWRWDIYKGLKELSERRKIAINIRYRPFSEQEFREKEIPVLKEWGFLISESLPENLMEDLCSSSVIMSATSSVLSTARLFGKLTYRVEDLSFRNSLMDKEVHDVSVEGIPDIVIPEGIENTAQEIDREGTFNIHNIL